MKTNVPPNQIKHAEMCWRCDDHLSLPSIANRYQWCHLAVFRPGEPVCLLKRMASGILAWSNDGDTPETLHLDFYGGLWSIALWHPWNIMRETFCLFLRNAKKAFVPPVIVKNEEQKARLKARKVVVLRQIPMHQMLVHGSIWTWVFWIAFAATPKRSYPFSSCRILLCYIYRSFVTHPVQNTNSGCPQTCLTKSFLFSELDEWLALQIWGGAWVSCLGQSFNISWD